MAKQRGHSNPAPAGVQRVQQRIEHWRKTREKRSPMPEPLWHAAVELAQRDGVYSISRALQLNYQTLQARLAMSGAGGKPQRMAPAPKGFVELGQALPMPAAPRTESVVELSDDEGAKLHHRFGARRLYGSDLLQEGPLRGGSGRKPLSGRDRRHAANAPGEASARPTGT